MRGREPALAPNVLAAIAEEPAALIAHGGVCEGGGSVLSDRLSSTRKGTAALTPGVSIYSVT